MIKMIKYLLKTNEFLKSSIAMGKFPNIGASGSVLFDTVRRSRLLSVFASEYNFGQQNRT